MPDFDPASIGAVPVSSARSVFNAGSTAGGTDVASSGNTSQDFDPASIGAKPVADTAGDFDPASIGASMVDPEAIKARIDSDPSFTPSNDEFRKIYDAENATPVASRILSGAGNAISTAVKNASGSAGEIADAVKNPSLENTGRAASTVLDAVSQAAAGAVGFVGKPIAHQYQKLQDLTSHPTLGNLARFMVGMNPSVPDDEAFNRWKLDYLTQLAQRQTSNSEEFQKSVLGIQKPFAPLPQTAATGALALQLLAAKAPAVGATGEAALAAQKAGAGTGVVNAALANAAQPAAQTVGEAAAAKAGGALETAGGITRKVAGFPRHAIEAVASPVVGEELAHKAAQIGEGIAAVHNPIVGAVAGAEGAGIGMERAGQAIKGLANTPAAGPFGRLVNFAKAADTPDWLKTLASNPAVKTLYGAASAAVPAIKGAATGVAKGAAVGAGYGLLAGDSPEELGSDTAAFGAFGVMHGGDAVKQQLFQRRAAGVAELVKQNLQAGVAPETLAKVPDAAMFAAADLPYLGIQDAQGKNLQVQFLDNAGMDKQGQTGADGFYDSGSHTIFLNADNLANNKAAWSSVFHEALHPLMESEVANRPDLAHQVDDAVSGAGLTLDEAKQNYVKNLLQPAFDAAKVTDPAAIQTQVGERIASLDLDSASRFGDPDHWIRSELLADAGRDALGTEKGMTSPEGSINQALKPTAGKLLQGAMEKLGVSFRQSPALGGTVIPGFQDVVSDPSLRKSVFRLLKAQRDFAPGVSAGAEQGVKLTPADMGTSKAPFYSLPNGRKGNKYSEVIPDGKGGEKTVMRNPGQVRKAERVEATAVKKYMQPGQRLSKMPQAFYDDPNIGEWTKQAARAAEASGAGGTPLEAWYHGIGKSGDANWKGSVRKTLGNVLASRQKFFVMPNGLFASKAGNPLMDVFSIAGFERKAQNWMNRTGPLSLERWGGDIGKFKSDVNTYNQNHAAGLPGDANNLGADKRNVINAFLYGRNAKYEANNPLRSLLRNSQDRQGIIRSLRLDRLETLEPGQTDLTRPDYPKGVQNFSPAAEDENAPNSLSEKDKLDEDIHGGAPDALTPEQQAKSAANNSRAAFEKLNPKGLPSQVNTPEDSAENTFARAATEHGQLHSSQFSPPAKDYKGESVEKAAYRLPDGNIVTGVTHADAYGNASDAYKKKIISDGEDGFVTNKNRFLNRQEAFELAKQANQIPLKAYKEETMGTWDSSEDPHKNKYLLEATAFDNTRKFSPKAKSLENAVGDQDIPVVHLTSRMNPGAKFVSPKNFGKGRANNADLRGGPKAYFFVKGSPLGGDEKIFGQGGYRARTGTVDGNKLYNLDAGRPDPLKYFSTPNREAADDNVKAAGYHGVLVGTDDGRKVVMMYRPVKVTDAGPFKGAVADTEETTASHRNSGLAFKDFFSKVTKGEIGKSEVPWTPLTDLSKVSDFTSEQTKHTGNFDEHIAKSIPGFRETQARTGSAIAKTFGDGANMLDIAASEGSYGKTISALSDGKIKTVSLDPNPDMANFFKEKSTVPGATYNTSAFQHSFKDGDTEVPAYKPKNRFDIVHESMGFQFISPDREGQIAEAKRLMTPDGVFLTEQKVLNPEWTENEAKKDSEYKSKYFSGEELAKKNKVVGFQQSEQETSKVGMLDNMVSDKKLEAVLKTNFKHVTQYWDSGNFKGYAASDDAAKLANLVKNMGDTKTDFSTTKTPHIVPQFSPQSKAGKALMEKGYDIRAEDFGAGVFDFRVTDNWGHEIGSLVAKQIDPHTAEVGMIRVDRKNRGEGVGTALYHELGHTLQQHGITKITGYNINPAVAPMREKVFGAAEQKGNQLISPVKPDKQFSPPSKDYRGEYVEKAATKFDDGKIYTGLTHADAFMARETERIGGRKVSSQEFQKLIGDYTDGFVTNKGRFLTREEAYNLARQAKQIGPKAYEEAAQTTWEEPPSPGATPILESTAFDQTRRFSPAAEAQVEEKKANRYANRIAFLTDKAGGATFNVAEGKFVGKNKNFGVSIYPDRSVILDSKDLTQDRVKQFIHDNADLLAKPENNVGTWLDKDSGKVYLDVSLGLPDRKLAEYAGFKYNQKAIWDSEHATEIPTGGTGEAVEQMPPAADRLKLLQHEYELQHPQQGQTSLEGMGRLVLNPRGEEVKNIRDLEAVRPDRLLTPNEQAASDLARKEVRQRVQLLPTADDKLKVRRALVQGVTEVSSMLDHQIKATKFDTGKDWYGKDIKKMESTTQTLFPETKDATKMTMFKLLLAGLSGGATPKENYSMAAEAFAHYLKTGEVPSTSDYRISEKGAKRQLGRSGKQTADKLNQMLEKHGGESGLTKYLLTKHAVTDEGNKDAYGALDIGPKYGRFFLNLTGHQDEVTVDLWATRTWRRWMGTPFSRVKGENGETRMEMTDIPTDSERNAILDAFKQIADNVNNEIAEPENHLTPMSVQAMLWFYEKDLFASRGLRVDRGSFSAAAEDYAKNPAHKRTAPVVTGAKKNDVNQLSLLP